MTQDEIVARLRDLDAKWKRCMEQNSHSVAVQVGFETCRLDVQNLIDEILAPEPPPGTECPFCGGGSVRSECRYCGGTGLRMT